MRAYLRVDPELAEHKEDYPDGAFAAFVTVLCAGEQQPKRGRFKTLKILQAYLGRRARWVSFLISKGDLRELKNGSIYIEGWDEWQEGDWKVRERVERIRARRALTVPETVEVTPDVTVDATVLDVNTSQDSVRAVGGRRLAVSGKADRPFQTTDRGVGVVEWWCLKKGWQSVPPSKMQKTYWDAESLAALSMAEEELIQVLDEVWARSAQEPDSLAYFWRPAQDRENELLKVRAPTAIATSTILRDLLPKPPEVSNS